MTDRQLIGELVSAVDRKYIDFNAEAKAFVRSLKGREELTTADRERARELFRREVDW